MTRRGARCELPGKTCGDTARIEPDQALNDFRKRRPERGSQHAHVIVCNFEHAVFQHQRMILLSLQRHIWRQGRDVPMQVAIGLYAPK